MIKKSCDALTKLAVVSGCDPILPTPIDGFACNAILVDHSAESRGHRGERTGRVEPVNEITHRRGLDLTEERENLRLKAGASLGRHRATLHHVEPCHKALLVAPSISLVTANRP